MPERVTWTLTLNACTSPCVSGIVGHGAVACPPGVRHPLENVRTVPFVKCAITKIDPRAGPIHWRSNNGSLVSAWAKLGSMGRLAAQASIANFLSRLHERRMKDPFAYVQMLTMEISSFQPSLILYHLRVPALRLLTLTVYQHSSVIARLSWK